MAEGNYYNILTSGGLGKVRFFVFSEAEIICIAMSKSQRQGESLFQFADERSVSVFQAAIDKMRMGGELFEVFLCGDGDSELIARAEELGAKEDALAFFEEKLSAECGGRR